MEAAGSHNVTITWTESPGSLSSSAIREDILRGTPLRRIMKPSLWRTSPVDLQPGAREALWDYSEECKEIETFISQTWGTPGWQKYVALLMHFYWAPAMISGGIAFLGLLALDVLGASPSFELSINESAESSEGLNSSLRFSPCLLLTPFVAIATLFLGPCIWRRSTLVFLDAVCINQSNDELKQEGIRSLGGFLANSKELLILWTPLYLSRAWCTYELAMFVSPRKDGIVTVCPIFQHLVILFGTLGVTVIVASVELIRILQAALSGAGSLVLYVAIVCSNLAPAFLLVHVWRPYIAQRQQLDKQLAEFEIAKAECREHADKEVILESVKLSHGSEEQFNHYVNTSLKEVVDALVPGVGLGYRDVVKMVFPVLCYLAALEVSFWRAGMPAAGLIARVVGDLAQCLCGYPVSMGLSFALMSRFSQRRSSRLADVVTTMLLGLAFLFLGMAIVFMRTVSTRLGLAGCIANVVLSIVMAWMVFAKKKSCLYLEKPSPGAGGEEIFSL